MIKGISTLFLVHFVKYFVAFVVNFLPQRAKGKNTKDTNNIN